MQYTLRTKCCTAPIFHSYSLLLIEKAFECNAHCTCTLVTGIEFGRSSWFCFVWNRKKNKRKKCISILIVVKSAYNFISTILYSECSIQQCKYNNHSLSFVYLSSSQSAVYLFYVCAMCNVHIGRFLIILCNLRLAGRKISVYFSVFLWKRHKEPATTKHHSTIYLFSKCLQWFFS